MGSAIRLMDYLDDVKSGDILYSSRINGTGATEDRLYDILHNGDKKSPSGSVRDFFHDLYPRIDGNERICAMLEYKGMVHNLQFGSIDAALETLCALADIDVNVYFAPAIFAGWRQKKNARRVEAIYVDIDDLDAYVAKMDTDSLTNYLISRYNLTPKMLPNWCVCSGHGLHLYYLINSLDLRKPEDMALRLHFTDYLVTFFRGDVACRDCTRLLRYPGSHNVKYTGDIRVTSLHRINPSTDRDYLRLISFKQSQDTVAAYLRDCQTRMVEKRRRTMDACARNPALLPDHIHADTAPAGSRASSCRKPLRHWIPPPPELRVITTPLPSTARYRRLLLDLHNWAARRGGVPVGYRNTFTLIVAVYCRIMHIASDTVIRHISHYLDSGFFTEAAAIVQYIYRTPTTYIYRNDTIAELLQFTAEDISAAYGHYGDDQRKLAHRAAVRRYDAKRHQTKRAAKAERTRARYEYILEHPEMSVSSLAAEMGCSVRTIQYYRAKLRKQSIL